MAAASEPVYKFAEVTSTMDVARRLVEEGMAPPFWVRADRQTAGRGRQGRRWLSWPGNLHATGVFIGRRPLKEMPALALVTGLAVIDCLVPLLPEAHRLALKWPNDVFLGERKLAGILCESEQRVDGGVIVLVGIGVNLEKAPQDTELPATALAEHGIAPCAPAVFLEGLIAAFARRRLAWEARGFAALREDYLRWMWGRGRQVVVIDEAGEAPRLAGRLVGIDDDGALLLETGQTRRRIVSGRLRAADGAAGTVPA